MIKSKLPLIRLFLTVVVVACHIAAYKMTSSAMMSTPNAPYTSEFVEIMGVEVAGDAIIFVVLGGICWTILIATLFIESSTESSPAK